MIAPGDLLALWITVKLALISTAVLLVIGTPLAWWLARTRWRGRPLVEALIALPLVLPPTVLGFYLLLALGPEGPLGAAGIALGGQSLAFTFTGLVIGSVFYSLPFVVQPLQAGFVAIDPKLLEVAETLRAGPRDRFFSVVLPVARPAFLTAAVLGFAHTLGEFGVVLMIGGSIPGETRVVSIAIYEHVEGLRYGQAHVLAALLLLLSFVMLLGVYALNRRFSVLRS
jgi:molybdate transport system permease protein